MIVERIKYYILILIAGLLLCSAESSYGQTYLEGRSRFFDNWRVNVNLGSMLFYGDIQQYRIAPYKEDWRMGYGLMFRKQFTPVFGLGFQLLNGRLHGTKLKYTNDKPANLMFDAKVFEYNLHTYFDISNLFGGYNPDRPISIYGLAGVGFSNWESEAKDYNTGKILRRSGFVGKGPSGRTTELVFPVGMGLRFNFNDAWGLNFESTLHGVNSDLLDASEGGFQYDVYNYSMLGLTYNFNNASIFQGDPAKREARIQRRQARLYERELNKYDNRVEYVKTKPSKSYEKELKKYEYQQKYDQPYEEPRQQDMRMSEPTEFREQQRRGDLPVVAEYEITGIFDRDQKFQNRPATEEPMEVEILKIPSATTFTTSTEIIEEEPQKGRILTDKGKIPNILRAENVYYDTKGNVTTPSQASQETNQNSQTALKSMEGVVFGVQILAKSTGRISIHDLANSYKIDTKIIEDHSNGLYRYVAGWFGSFDEASRYARILRNKGIYDAFVVAYRNGQRISLSTVMH